MNPTKCTSKLTSPTKLDHQTVVESYDSFTTNVNMKPSQWKKNSKFPHRISPIDSIYLFFMKSKELLIFLGILRPHLGHQTSDINLVELRIIGYWLPSNAYPLATVSLSWGDYTSSTGIHLQKSINHVLIISSGPCLNTGKPVDSEGWWGSLDKIEWNIYPLVQGFGNPQHIMLAD